MKSSDLNVTSNDVISSKEPKECVIVNLVQAHLDSFLSFQGVNWMIITLFFFFFFFFFFWREVND